MRSTATAFDTSALLSIDISTDKNAAAPDTPTRFSQSTVNSENWETPSMAILVWAKVLAALTITPVSENQKDLVSIIVLPNSSLAAIRCTQYFVPHLCERLNDCLPTKGVPAESQLIRGRPDSNTRFGRLLNLRCGLTRIL